MNSALPVELKELVFSAVKLLGEAIKDQYGLAQFNKIESIRQSFKKTRGSNEELLLRTLKESHSEIKNLPKQDLQSIANAFSMMLEIINCCESAYRISQKNRKIKLSPTDQQVIFVLTSHPTEARSSDYLKKMELITELLIIALEDGFEKIEDKLKFELSVVLNLEITKHNKPSVKDEYQEIYQRILDKRMIDKQIEMLTEGVEVSYRTWSGGDKDGHPGVGHSEMTASLTESRGYLVKYIRDILTDFSESLSNVPKAKKIKLSLVSLTAELNLLKKIEDGDGLKITRFRKKFNSFLILVKSSFLYSSELDKIKKLIWIYPALVMPLEIREDSEIVGEAIKDKKQNIHKMLLKLKKISRGFDPKWYVRGFIVSMCQTEKNLSDGVELIRKCLGGYLIPVVPLFENEKGMLNAINILSYNFKKHSLFSEHSSRWNSKFEVMIGYSDSSKEGGVLAARVMLQKTIHLIDGFISSQNLRPVFFHGSGGSITRGGGSTKEQISWWPKSCLSVFKMTVQGESIQRNLGHPLLVQSTVAKITEEFSNFSTRNLNESKVIDRFSSSVRAEYSALVNDSDFQKLVLNATPYQFLDTLKLGSRPDKRSQGDNFSLRAIPWVLCWTQTRILMPVWWGIGKSWASLGQSDKNDIIAEFKTSPLLFSYFKHLGFTLEKCSPTIWYYLIDNSKLSENEKRFWIKSFKDEISGVKDFFRDVSGGQSLLWFRPWLKESIYFRSSMIHPLNVIQKIAIERNDQDLLRTSVAGISSGMLTTG